MFIIPALASRAAPIACYFTSGLSCPVDFMLLEKVKHKTIHSPPPTEHIHLLSHRCNGGLGKIFKLPSLFDRKHHSTLTTTLRNRFKRGRLPYQHNKSQHVTHYQRTSATPTAFHWSGTFDYLSCTQFSDMLRYQLHCYVYCYCFHQVNHRTIVLQ